MILGPGPRIICLNFVDIHYHGCQHADAGELCHTKPRDGTSQCHRYLAGFVLCRAKPLVVAVTPVRGDEPTSDGRVTARPRRGPAVRLAELLADRGFYDGMSIERLDAAAPVALPIIRRGKQMAEKLDTTMSYRTEYVMYERSERELRFSLAVCVSYQQGTVGNMACLTGRTWREIWPIARPRTSKPSTRNAQPSRQPSERCANKHD